jgi:hypothetical protein
VPIVPVSPPNAAQVHRLKIAPIAAGSYRCKAVKMINFSCINCLITKCTLSVHKQPACSKKYITLKAQW